MRRFLPLLALPLWAVLSGFTPFTAVQSVCPGCPKGRSDEVKLISGETLRCQVLAQNDDYYVVTRFGEHRAVMKNEIASIKWAVEGTGAKVGGDQVLLKNGVVLHGSVVEQQSGRWLMIEVGSARHVVWLSQIQRLHRAGRQQDLAAFAAPAPTNPN